MSLRGVVIAGLMATAFLSTARADLVPSLDAISGSGPYTFQYSVTLTSTERIDTPGPNNVTSFFTIYDIAGLTAAIAPAGWAVSVQDPGTTPAGLTPVDGALPNVTWTYIGAGVIGTGQTFTGFNVTSTLGGVKVGNYTQESTNNAPGTAGQRDFNGGFVGVPAEAGNIPEPATLALFGAGAVLLGLIRRRRNS